MTDHTESGQQWLPTAHNINALPAPVRKYIHDLEANADPAGLVRENTLLKDCNQGLQAMYRKVADVAPIAPADEPLHRLPAIREALLAYVARPCDEEATAIIRAVMHVTKWGVFSSDSKAVWRDEAQNGALAAPAPQAATPAPAGELPPLPTGYVMMMTPDPEGTPAEWFDASDMRAYALAARAPAAAAASGQREADRWGDVAMPPEIEQRVDKWLTNGAALHPMTVNLVVRFARAIAMKLAAAEVKYGYSDGWLDPNWMDECRQKMQGHIAKGDPRDVAAYCAFLWHHGASTATPPPSPLLQVAGEPTNEQVAAYLEAQRAYCEEADRNWGRAPGGGLYTDTVKEACRAGLRAAGISAAPPQPVQAETVTIITINGYQLRQALEFIAPDDEEDQLEQFLRIKHGPFMSEEGEEKMGLVCWMDEYPEEGGIELEEEPPRPLEGEPTTRSGV